MKFSFRTAWLLTWLMSSVVLTAYCDQGNIIVKQDIAFDSNEEGELLLDIAYPNTTAGSFPGIIFVHSGGWRGGEKRVSDPKQAAAQGYVAISINYRLTNVLTEAGAVKYPFPAQIEDVKCAIRWMRAHAEQYHLDPEHIGIVGASAGGQLALLTGFTPDMPEFEGSGGYKKYSSSIQAVVNCWGPADLVINHKKGDTHEQLQALLGGTPDEAAERYRQASPTTYVTKDAPPVLTFHGEEDELVPIEGSRVLDTMMKEIGADHTLVIFPGQNHGLRAKKNRNKDKQQVSRQMFTFLDKHLKQDK